MSTFEPLHDVVLVTVVMRSKGIGFRRLGAKVSLGIIHESMFTCVYPSSCG